VKVVLINPSINFQKFGKFKNLLEPMPCIGIAYLAAILEKNNVNVTVLDDFVLRLGVNGLFDKVKEIHPEIVGISTLTPSYEICINLARKIKKFDKNIKIILGNIHASFFAQEILEKEPVDIIVHSEGELTISELVSVLRDRGDLEKIKGISYKDHNEIIHNERRELLQDLDSLPFPAWHLFPVDEYGLLPFADIKKPILTILASRGCPFKCTFCSISYKKENYRKRDVKKVVDEIEYLIDRFKVQQIGFVDPIFPLNKNHCKEFCKEMIKRGLNKKIIWTTETRVDMIDEDIAKIMKEAGCRRLIFGIESGVQELLRNVKKEYTLEEAQNGVRNARKASIETVGLFMIGLPGETKSLTEQTIKFAKKLDLDFAKFAITIPYPGTELYDNLRRSGWNRTDWENFSTFNPDPDKLVFVPDGMTAEELIHLQKRANYEFYFRPKMIYRHLFQIKTIRVKDIVYGLYSLLT